MTAIRSLYLWAREYGAHALDVIHGKAHGADARARLAGLLEAAEEEMAGPDVAGRLAAAEARCGEALDVLTRYGQTDGAHHKTWVIDQAVRALTGDGYDEHIRRAKDGEDGPDTYVWDEGIAP